MQLTIPHQPMMQEILMDSVDEVSRKAAQSAGVKLANGTSLLFVLAAIICVGFGINYATNVYVPSINQKVMVLSSIASGTLISLFIAALLQIAKQCLILLSLSAKKT
jgi:hypothetical protein